MPFIVFMKQKQKERTVVFMSNIMEQLEALSNREWEKLFSTMETEERRSVASLDNSLLYRYMGEIDFPEDMLQDFATMEDIRRCGGRKTNWFLCSDGSFITCGDCATDALFESGKVVNHEFPFEIERNEKYDRLSKDERIAFRVELQGISETEAKEIVCYELGIPAYENIYMFSVEEILLDSSNNSEETKTYTRNIEADTEEEAREKFVSESRKVGSVVSSGRRFTAEDNRKMRESGKLFGYKGGIAYTITLKSRNITLVEVKKNNCYWD